MNDTQDSPVEAALPQPRIVHSRRPRLSLVWLVPLVALAIGVSLMVRSYLATGPRIEIDFRTAEGLEPGKTEVRYKEVVVGRVQSVHLRENRQRVVATVQLERSAATLAVDDTAFWVVRPRIGAGGVSGLGTLLSGAYIGVDAGSSETTRTAFLGLEAPPYVLRGEPGASFVLKAADLGSLDVGSPVLYRRAPVGRVVGYTLDPTKDELQVKIFIEAPYHRLVKPGARFWNASGIDLSIDANGLSLNSQTAATLMAGGITFENPFGATAPEPAPNGSSFQLFDNRKAALALPSGTPLPVRMMFQGSLRGLSLGAPIDFLGVEVGKVSQVSLQYDAAHKAASYPVLVLAELYPQRLGAVRAAMMPAGASGAQAEVAMLQKLVDNGLRAQLRTGNLLTGHLYVALDFQAKTERALLPKLPKPNANNAVFTLPTVPGTLSELQSQVADVLARLGKLPLEDIATELVATLKQAKGSLAQVTPDAQQTLAQAQRTLAGAQALMQQLEPEARNTLEQAQRALNAAQTTFERVDQQMLNERAPVQRQLEQALLDFQRAAQSLRALTDALQRHPESLLRGLPADPSLPKAPALAPLTEPAKAS